MNRLNQKYLADAERKVRQHGTVAATGNRQRKIGADGWLQRQMGFSAHAEAGQFFPADGGKPGPQGGFSQPIVLQLSNSSASSTSINLWGASVYLDTTSYTWAAGSLTQNNVKISVVSTTSTLNTYFSALQSYQFMTVGKTQIQTISGPDAQITQTWGLNTFATNANFAGQQFVNIPDPMQFKSNVINNFQQYDIDPTTYLTVPILGSAVFLMLFYPLADINLSRSLINQGAAKTFGPPPGNLAPQPVSIVNG